MQRIGRIGTEIEPIITPKAKRLVVEAPIYFNQHIPGVKDGTLEVMGIFLDDKAEKINEMAQQRDEKYNLEAQGRGMLVEVLGKLYTHKYENNAGIIVKQTRMHIYDVAYPTIYTNELTNVNTSTNQTNAEGATNEAHTTGVTNKSTAGETPYPPNRKTATKLPVKQPPSPTYGEIEELDDPFETYNQMKQS